MDTQASTTAARGDLTRFSASDVLSLIHNDEVSVEEYAKALLARVEARDSIVKAWAFLDHEHVLKEAERLDAVPKEKRGPLHGVAIGVKDIMFTKDMPTQFNSRIFKDNFPAVDANCIMTLRQAGALIFGKTTTTEFAACMTGGKTTNPHDPSRTPGGSSSGSAAAVADFQVPIALGTQTAGSMIRPASFNGIWSMKVTWGSITREGLGQHSPTNDTFGFFARSIDDLALLASIFKLSDDLPPPNASLSISGAKVAFVKTSQWSHVGPGTVAAMTKGAAILGSAGAEVTDLELPGEFARIPEWHTRILAGEGRTSFLGQHALAKEMLDPVIRGYAELTNQELSKRDLLEAYDGIARLRPIVDEILSRFDAVITPSAPDEAPVGLASTGSPAMNSIWTVLHTPTINIPGFKGANGMPIGLTIVGPRFHDQKLLRAAKAIGALFEQGGGWQSGL